MVGGMAVRIKKRKNPLARRIMRELAGDWKKYLVVSLFLILTIGFVSGMYVANGSMEASAYSGRTLYRLEDGHFELKTAADEDLITAIESGEKVPVTVYQNFYKNETEDRGNDGISDGTVRVYAANEDVNLACLMDGRFPKEQNEIAIDQIGRAHV